MPLSEPQERSLLHQRAISIDGYQRADGLFDIEAELTDTKTYGFLADERGLIEPGVPLHHMRMRMTVDDKLSIVACEASTLASPYPSICPSAAPNFARLAGLDIRRGFLKAAAERIGGTEGCTHLRELLQQMATVAFQTLAAVRRGSRPKDASPATEMGPSVLNTCLAWSSDSPVVGRRWPHLYTGPQPISADPLSAES